MTPHRTGRGRPKGTGLNDAAHLEAIAGLLAAQPDLKPTTAIRKLGINDPSVIRRLRDKYHAMAVELEADVKAGAAKARDALPLVQRDDAQVRAMPLAGARDIRRRCAASLRDDVADVSAPLPSATAAIEQPVITAQPATVTPPIAAVSPMAPLAPVTAAADETIAVRPVRRPPAFMRPSETELPSWMGVGMSLYVFTFEAQYAALGTLMQWSPMTNVIKNQAALVESAVALMSPSRLTRSK